MFKKLVTVSHRVVLLAICLLASPQNASSVDQPPESPQFLVNDALAYHRNNEHKKAFEVCSHAVKIFPDRRVRRCAELIAYYYGKGVVVPNNFQKSMEWLEFAALHGAPESQYIVGKSYYYGEKVLRRETNYPLAEKWLRKASLQGHKDALFLLGKLYYRQKGPIYGQEKNYEAALHWFELSGQQEHGGALAYLSTMYEKGLGVKPDPQKALQFLERSAEKDNLGAQVKLFKKIVEGKGVPLDTEKAMYWLERAGSNGDTDSLINLSVFYYKGIYVEKDKQRALYWAEKAANQPDPLPVAIKNLDIIKQGIKQDAYSLAAQLLTSSLFMTPKNTKVKFSGNVGECYQAAQERVTFCMVSFDKEFGTGEIYDIDVDCRGGHKAKACERRLETAVQFALLDDIQVYCDLENSSNWDVEEARVIEGICAD